MKINEIFFSIEGEGKRVGQPCVFIRRSGCNLHCKYDGKDCDTPYRDEGTEMTVDEIMDKVLSYDCKNVTLTGGEPLLPGKELEYLRSAMLDAGLQVNIETNGTMSTEHRYSNEFFTVDYKCGCSGETKSMNIEAFVYLMDKDVVKFVVSDEDLKGITAIIKDLSEEVYNDYYGHPMFYLSPCYGRCNLESLAEKIKELYAIYPKIGLSLQVHKIIWSPDKRGV